MTNCRPGKSFDLHKAKRKLKDKTSNDLYTILEDKYITPSDSVDIRLQNEESKVVIRKNAFDFTSDNKKTVSESVEMKLSLQKARNWLKSLPSNNYVKAFIVGQLLLL